MFRSSLLVAVSGLALAACQPASDAPTELSAETPPVIEESVDVVETVEAEIEPSSNAVEEVVEAAAEPAEEHDHDDEDHADEGDDHDHDEEHEDHADEHDHDEHAHEDDDHDHAGGEAHVHGLSELAASLDGSTLSVNVEGALANFDLEESLRTLDDPSAYTDRTAEIVGGDCTRSGATASIRPIGDHGNLVIDLTYDCAAPDTLEAINVTGFQSFAGFVEVNAVFLTETGQTAETLTESDTRLDLN
ncbi:MAG: DUF2796 domain-containing protein [Henriciella sp.]